LGPHSASYPMDNRDYFPGGKAAGVWSWPSTAEVKNVQALYLHSPNTPSCRGVQLKKKKHRENLTFTLPYRDMYLYVLCTNFMKRKPTQEVMSVSTCFNSETNRFRWNWVLEDGTILISVIIR